MQYLEDILTNLTPDDVRHLIQAEDELTQKANLERIFPTATTYSYLEYMAGPRYYNRLFDAWECKYGNNRKIGKFCLFTRSSHTISHSLIRMFYVKELNGSKSFANKEFI